MRYVVSTRLSSKEICCVLSKCGVYKLECDQCNAVFVGQNLSAFRNIHPEKSRFAKR